MSAEPPREFVDTNVLVYAYDKSAGLKAERARDLVAGLWRSGEGCISLQVLQELFVTITRKVAKPMPAAGAAALIEDLSQWTLHEPVRADVLAAIDLHRRKRISFWDALILQSAHQLRCQTIWSEDLNAGQAFGAIRVRNPFA
ncbi:MAG: PIN domain-containing protein [Acidobacteriota bacterium]|nr:PIN domain-containing protein [Acidobacteriota bacterium]